MFGQFRIQFRFVPLALLDARSPRSDLSEDPLRVTLRRPDRALSRFSSKPPFLLPPPIPIPYSAYFALLSQHLDTQLGSYCTLSLLEPCSSRRSVLYSHSPSFLVIPTSYHYHHTPSTQTLSSKYLLCASLWLVYVIEEALVVSMGGPYAPGQSMRGCFLSRSWLLAYMWSLCASHNHLVSSA
ncbi:hypothetical protein BDQ17DRAFT_1367232 [Cyathus striatus]|nr:hypothetical protein BDQ17DRAFT_1367232 [Cyathus striatus]